MKDVENEYSEPIALGSFEIFISTDLESKNMLQSRNKIIVSGKGYIRQDNPIFIFTLGSDNCDRVDNRPLNQVKH